MARFSGTPVLHSFDAFAMSTGFVLACQRCRSSPTLWRYGAPPQSTSLPTMLLTSPAAEPHHATGRSRARVPTSAIQQQDALDHHWRHGRAWAGDGRGVCRVWVLGVSGDFHRHSAG